LLRFWMLCRWHCLSPPVQTGRGGGSRFGSPLAPFILCGGAWTHAPPVVAASGADAPPPLPQFLRGCSAVPRLFRDFFVTFTCLNMYLNFC
jgi:hypothetical protein